MLLAKRTGLQLVKKFPAFRGTRKFITALTSVRHLTLSWASPIQSIYPHPTSRRTILILSTHLCLGLPSGLWRQFSKIKAAEVWNLDVVWKLRRSGTTRTSPIPRQSSCSIQAQGYIKKRVSLQTLGRSRWPCYLRRGSTAAWLCWNRRFESRWGHGCPFLVFVVLCVGCGLCDELITDSEEPYWDCVSNDRYLNNETAWDGVGLLQHRAKTLACVNYES